MTEPTNDMGCARLVDPGKLRKLVHNLKLEPMDKEFIEARWAEIRDLVGLSRD